jgi:hypothetical protein
MKAFNRILVILFMVGALLQCSSRSTNSEADPDKRAAMDCRVAPLQSEKTYG